MTGNIPIDMQLTEVDPRSGEDIGAVIVNLADHRAIYTRPAQSATRKVTTILFPGGDAICVREEATWIANQLGDALEQMT